MEYDVETIVVGAGVIGLAIARSLALSNQDVLVLEKNGHFGEETSSRNSEVIHAGIYYPKDSLKAKLCVEGKSRLYQYCENHNIPHKRTGKLIVATTPEECDVLENILNKAQDNNVQDLKFISKKEVSLLEPQLRCEQALLSPSTGIIDTHQYMLSLVGEIEANKGAIAYHAPFSKAEVIGGGFLVTSGDNQLRCKRLINSAGLGAQSVAHEISGLSPEFIPTRYLAKGTYFTASFPSPFKHLIYPVPNTASLGIHVTLDMAGQIRFGPDQEWVDTVDYSLDEGRSHGFYEAIRRYYPDLKDDSLQPGYTGIRPKLQSPGSSAQDFQILSKADHQIPGLICLFGMESPGLTASLAIAETVKKCL
ncbi:NAD(P)/FAD-dependent oxidoreductase [Sneathiella sp.]|jgi:L-2-hydroxyglutarate oxidase LhgO|uniref:NAD(P)/FAD-dependent oxidoreductase n=1 Tax=Sneathiella sp. TaxID=1964365 RepID=UPI0039E689AD